MCSVGVRYVHCTFSTAMLVQVNMTHNDDNGEKGNTPTLKSVCTIQ